MPSTVSSENFKFFVKTVHMVQFDVDELKAFFIGFSCRSINNGGGGLTNEIRRHYGVLEEAKDGASVTGL
jgi:hypothetical protein